MSDTLVEIRCPRCGHTWHVDVATLGTGGRPVWCEPSGEHLRARLREAANQPRRAASMGRAAQRQVKRRFGWAQSAQRLIEIVNQLEVSHGQARAADSPAATGVLV